MKTMILVAMVCAASCTKQRPTCWHCTYGPNGNKLVPLKECQDRPMVYVTDTAGNKIPTKCIALW